MEELIRRVIRPQRQAVWNHFRHGHHSAYINFGFDVLQISLRACSSCVRYTTTGMCFQSNLNGISIFALSSESSPTGDFASFDVAWRFAWTICATCNSDFCKLLPSWDVSCSASGDCECLGSAACFSPMSAGRAPRLLRDVASFSASTTSELLMENMSESFAWLEVSACDMSWDFRQHDTWLWPAFFVQS